MSLSKDADRGAKWSYEKTITLINIWSDTNVQDEFEKSRRNADIYEKMAKKNVGFVVLLSLFSAKPLTYMLVLTEVA